MVQFFRVLFSFFKIGAFTIGGGYAMLPLIEKEVTEKGWVNKEEIVDVLAVAQSVPGVIAVNSCIFIGYKIGGITMAIAATLGMIIPSLIIIIAISSVLMVVKDNLFVKKAFAGVRAGVTSMVILAAIKIGKSILKDAFSYILAVLSLIAVVLLDIHPIIVILSGAFAGLIHYTFIQKGAIK